MAYKFQIGAARLSGSIIQTDGDGDLRATTVDSLSSGIVTASGLSSLDGGINTNDDFTVDVDGNIVAVAATLSGLASLDAGIDVNGSNFTVSAAGAVVAVGVNAGGAITGATTIAASGLSSLASISVDDGSTIGPDSVADLITLSADGDFTFKDGTHDLNIASHDGTNGLALAGTIVSSTAAELNLLDAMARGSILVGNSSAASAALTKGAASTFLQSDGTDIAYVAMSGDATLSAGALTIADNAVSLAKMAGLTRGSIIIGDSSGDPSALVKGAASTFLQSDGTDTAYVAMSGDATLSAGAISIGATRVTDAMLNDDVATGLAGAGSTATSGVINVIGGDGITANANDIAVTAAQTTITSVLNAALVVGRNANNKVDFATDNFVKIYSNGAERLVINDTGNTIVKGNLLVEGTTTTIDSTTINVSRSLTFEGPASDFECIFGYGATDAPLQDITVILPEYSSSAGAHNVKAAVLAAGGSAADYLAASFVKPEEFKLLDGATAASSTVTIVDADRMILNDNGTMKQVAMSDVKTYAEEAANALTVAVVANAATLGIDVVSYVADRDGAGQNVGVNLPASNDNLIGKSIYIKAGNLENSAKVTVQTAAAGQKIDGADEIILESPYASVRLIYVVADQWRVF